MKKVSLFLMAAFAALFFTACGGSDKKAEEGEAAATEAAAPADKHYTAAELVDLDLSAQGVNAVVKAPAGAEVKKSSDGREVYVQAGKFFKMTVKNNEGSSADFLGMVKPMASDKELNPSFDKFEEESATGYLKKNTDGKMSFMHMIDKADGNSLVISEGVPFDVNSDGNTEYSADDVKVMYEAAKAAKAK